MLRLLLIVAQGAGSCRPSTGKMNPMLPEPVPVLSALGLCGQATSATILLLVWVWRVVKLLMGTWAQDPEMHCSHVSRWAWRYCLRRETCILPRDGPWLQHEHSAASGRLGLVVCVTFCPHWSSACHRLHDRGFNTSHTIWPAPVMTHLAPSDRVSIIFHAVFSLLPALHISRLSNTWSCLAALESGPATAV